MPEDRSARKAASFPSRERQKALRRRMSSSPSNAAATLPLDHFMLAHMEKKKEKYRLKKTRRLRKSRLQVALGQYNTYCHTTAPVCSPCLPLLPPF
ncbi:unnamed protein product [Nezara viridula]|uniref:Uncharacterized protein n=1 Tax=Nezara viridula TaxID=85310 RepID=A0A9P0HG40_NEZVI|nr:unnamed protein product [Nezara viridula]